MVKETRRVHFYIDAFNVWHRIRDHRKHSGEDYRWLDYAKACRNVVGKNKQLFEGGTLGQVTLFTTKLADWWSKERRARHQTLVRALRVTGTEVVDRGYFQRVREAMRDEQTGEVLLNQRGNAGKRWRVTEKQTDANIVTRMVGDAARASARGEFGVYMLFSGDNDLTPALDEVRKFKQKAGVILPPTPYNKDKDLENAASTNNGGAPLIVRMRFKNFDGCCLPQNPGNDEQGEIIMPEEYEKF